LLNRSDELVHEELWQEELFSAPHFEQYATTLARELQIKTKKTRKTKSLRPELKKNTQKLEEAYQILAHAIQQKQNVSPAAIWFVDNFHIIETHLKDIKQSLPDNYYYGLPQISSGELRDYPRVYALALAIASHTDSRLDLNLLSRFLHGFQKEKTLEIGELWAFSITLRIVMIQNLTVLAMRIIRSRDNRERADQLAERLLAFAVKPGVTEKEIQVLLEKEVGDPKNLNRAFIVQLIQRLRDQDPAVAPAFDWIERKLVALKTNAQEVTKIEMHRLAAGQLTVGNIIASMRLLSTMDYREFFESVSLVDPILAQDPLGAYRQMDFSTRDAYRHVIESISKRSKLTEVEVAEKVLAEAKKAPPGSVESHVGHYLLGNGKEDFREICGYTAILRRRFFQRVLFHPTGVYLTLVTLSTLIFLLPVIWYFSRFTEDNLWIVLFGLLAIIPASDLALSFLNHYVTFFVKPKPLPRMETEHGISGNAVTMVVIPTLFTKEATVRELVDRLEIHALANHDPNISFAILSDFADAPSEVMTKDQELLTLAQNLISDLNQRYHSESGPKFHLFHRRRQWNAAEGAWIGWERKRGKLLEFNRLLRGAKDTSYIIVTADEDYLSQVKYVITLDSDTQLPRDAARKLIGTITHPLNWPQVDHKKRRVTSGYGILQPRVSITGESASESYFSRLSSGNIGIDPYTTAVSDVYQDLFKEGSFTGKGLYVVDAFEEVMEGRVPENAVLSHDLFEGSYARSALVTDVEFFDDYPSDYETYSKRGHRWTRGDWQNAPWHFPKVRNARGERVRNDLSIISRWKIFDNLRRSLSPLSAFIWLFLSWTVMPGNPLVWTALIMALFLFPVYSTVATGEWMRRKGLTWQGHFLGGVREFKIKVGQIFLLIAFLPKQAWTQIDAILRVFYRMTVSKKKLLEWTSFAQLASSRKEGMSPRDFLDSGPIIGFITLVSVAGTKPQNLSLAIPFCLLWLVNPFIKDWLARKPKRKFIKLTETAEDDFYTFARRTWHFFETFLNKDGNWLAPDNFQEDPKPVVAHRTSPTNIGLQFLAKISAYDLGFLGREKFILLSERAFDSLEKLERMHGHFFNWYDTKTLVPLEPRYISTVDSGNLAGHLVAFKQFVQELQKTEQSLEIRRQGLSETLKEVLRQLEYLHHIHPPSGMVNHFQLKNIISSALEIANTVADEQTWFGHLANLKTRLLEASEILEILLAESRDPLKPAEVKGWMDAALEMVSAFMLDLDYDRPSSNQRLKALCERADALIKAMDFRFLFDDKRKLFVIGFNATDSRLDNSYYDLLASESRLASFIAIAKGDVPQEHWFRLGRQMSPVRGGKALIAWTATMFEYLMPVLVMKRFQETILDQTYVSVVQRQQDYGVEKNVPWGISEAGYNARDLQMNYQYGPFGIPGLGLKRGLSEELVVSPYSTMLASLIDPLSALENLRKLAKLGAYGRFGFYESLDYTAERVPKNQKFVILKSFMAHHQGMSLVAINNLLSGNSMQRRFHADPMVMATELLLQERVPRDINLSQPRTEEINISAYLHSAQDFHPRLYSDVNLSLPRTQLLSNGHYTVMLTSTGAGFSKAGPLAISRWREDSTRDQWGQFYYIRNRTKGGYWSATHQPTLKTPQSFGATFSEDKVEYWRRDDMTLTRTEIVVSQEDNVELRKITLSNESREVQEYEVTSFMEAVLAKPNDDAAHPAFSNLFVQTEFVSNSAALLGTRRKRKNQETPPWGLHLVSTDGETIGAIQYETDRARFIGRGKNVSAPLVMEENRPLSNSAGSVLDPAFSLRITVRVKPGESTAVTFVTGIASERSEALGLIDKYRDPVIFRREAEIAWTQAQVQLRHLNVSNAEAHVYQRLAGRVLYLDSSLRPASHVLAQNSKAQSRLWAYGISGDLPIILTQIDDEKDMSMVRELLHAHEYLRLKGLAIDLVILNAHATSYLQTLSDEIYRQIRMSGSQALMDKPGGVFVRRTDLLPAEDIILLRTVAKVVLVAERGSLDEQLKHRKPRSEMPPALLPKAIVNVASATKKTSPPATERPDLSYFNGIGGFAEDGREYVITLQEDQWTPAPWINVIANSRDFGFIVSESGSGFTWSANSRENRLTPWSNDPVSDPPGEVIYIRDEDNGLYWTPTPLPIRESESYFIHHGQGYTTFRHESHGIDQELTQFVPMDAEVKISRLTLKNNSTSPRRLSVTSYVEWVLGFNRSNSAAYVIPELDQETGALTARNPYNNEFAQRIAFADISEKNRTFTCDRREFLGRNGSPERPAAMRRAALSGTQGAGLDPCAAFQTKMELAPGEERTIVILLGETDSLENARKLVRRYRDLSMADQALIEAKQYWEDTCSKIEIDTPEKAMNILVNRWLLYQTLSCRIWARSAFYQSGGAYGFRDQLQDVMALCYTHPEITRAQILTAAQRQFKEGDVQHWWHPPTGRGVRTHFSDDLIWLPFVTSYYIKITGDKSILNEIVPFIEAPLLAQGQEDAYTHPVISEEMGSIFEHCARTLDRSLKVGAHGLPLMGAGDWNDGMNRVGHEGYGESVWVAWFLYSALTEFIPLCEEMDDLERAKKYRLHLNHLKAAVEDAWDGDWYRRAYFDDGSPLGSAQNEECKIDSISNSWAVISGAGDETRRKRAMEAVEQYLIRRGDGLIQLFTPPFDKTSLDPGYIKGYVPGVRENGGQYTHAAIWTVMAFAELGDGDRAQELYALLNPINHGATRAGLHKYKVEPYVVAADIYGMHPHVGRGGWTWYTGSASWMYRSALESILGFDQRGDKLRLNPKVPGHWREFSINYRYGKSLYRIHYMRSDFGKSLQEMDGEMIQDEWLTLKDDGREHLITIQR
jgi:cyclic beta-1,2-glucan synthetase